MGNWYLLHYFFQVSEMHKGLHPDAKFQILRDSRFQIIDVLELLAGETGGTGEDGLCPCGGIFAKLR